MKRIEHNEEKWIFPFIEYSGNITENPNPLIIQLHGAGDRGNGRDELNRVEKHGFSSYLQNAQCQCTVIMPQCPTESFWAAKVESIIKFVEQLKNEFDIDENRVYLTGLSMGGYGTWYTAMAKPELFAAIAPVCGGGMAWNAEVLNMPIWAFHGVDDDVVSVYHTDDMVNKLTSLGKNIKYTRLNGVKHNSWEYAYNEELMNWLLSKKRTN